jgi:4-amino-4-deoxy-L-arabinose transferase-like glycosyltransferase
VSATTIDPTRGGLTRPSRGRLAVAYGLPALLAVALLFRVIVVLTTPHFVPHTDAADYDRIAVSLAQHDRFPSSVLAPSGGPTAYRTPLFPLALAAVYKIVGIGSATTRWEAGRMLEAVLGVIAVALIYAIAARIWDRRAGLVAAGIGAVYPPLVLVGSSLMSESLFIPLVLAAVLAALRHRSSPHRWRWAVAAGVLVGLAALTRSNGVVLVIPVAFLAWSRRPRWTWDSLRSPVTVGLALVATLVPWTIRNDRVFHSFVPISTEGGYALAGTYSQYAAAESKYPAMWAPPVFQQQALLARHPGDDEAQLSSGLLNDGLRYMEHHPSYVAKALYWNALRLLNVTGGGYERYLAPYESYPKWLATDSVYAFWVLGLLALAGCFVVAARKAPWALWGCPLAVFCSTVVFLGATRYRAPADPFLIMLAALALVAAWDGRRGSRGRPVASAAA